MRRLIYGIMMLLLFARCADFIDVVPENSTTFTSFFQTEKDAEALLNSLKSLPACSLTRLKILRSIRQKV